MDSLRILLVGVCVCVPVVASAQTKTNGISVSSAKVFDNRALVIMLEQLEAQLRSLQVMDQQKVVQGLTNLQGAQVSDVTRSVSATGLGRPGVTATEGLTDGQLGVTGRVTTEAARAAPVAPEATSATPGLTYAPAFGLNAQDLLSDQISLTYQILNVRMLLERALSDRLHDERPRLQAVLGFQIGIDPPRNANGRAAFVEITVGSKSGTPLSLVSVMPQEKTYNAYAVDRRSNAFGGAAVASVLTIGYAQQRRNEVLYLYRDADTLGMLNPTPGPESGTVTFGWVFRPVLGRQAVSPGIRQMFAVLALPVADELGVSADLAVSVRTHWRKYDRKKMTTDSKEEASVEAGLGHVTARSSEEIAAALAPVIKDVRWRAVDSEVAVVSITGSNLFVGTQVLLGRTAYDSPAKGLLFKSDNTLELHASMRDVAFGDAEVSGRFGPPQPLIVEPPVEKFGPGIEIYDIRFAPEPGRASMQIDVFLKQRGEGHLTEMPPDQPLLIIGTFVTDSLFAQRVDCEPRPDRAPAAAPVKVGKGCLQLTGVVPVSVLEQDPVVTVKYPFRGDCWKHGYPVFADSVAGVTRLGGDKTIKLSISGRGFSKNTQVILDRNYAPTADVTPTLITVEIDASTLAKYKKLIVKGERLNPVVVDIPDGTPPPRVARIDAGQKPRVRKDATVGVTLTGSGLTAIKSAKFDGKNLPIQIQENGKRLIVYLSRDMTAKTGEAVILLETSDEIVPVTVIIDA